MSSNDQVESIFAYVWRSIVEVAMCCLFEKESGAQVGILGEYQQLNCGPDRERERALLEYFFEEFEELLHSLIVEFFRLENLSGHQHSARGEYW